MGHTLIVRPAYAEAWIISPPPPTATQWTNGDGDNLWETPLNWTNGVPTALLDCIMGGVSDDECIVPDDLQQCLSLDLTGYAGSIHKAASDNVKIRVYGDVVLDVSCTTPGYIRPEFFGVCTIDGGGFPRVFLDCDDATSVTLLSDINCYELDGTNDVVIDLGGFDIVFSDDSEAVDGGAYTDSSENMLFTTGRIRVTATDPITFEGDGGTGVWAPIVVEEGAAGVIADADLICDAWTQESGDLTTDGAELEVINDFIFNGDTITDAIVSVGGTAEAHDSTVTNADFSGGTQLDATDNCVDGGGNTNVDFGLIGPALLVGGTTDITGSSDGSTWALLAGFLTSNLQGIVRVGLTWFAAAFDTKAYSSTDGATFTWIGTVPTAPTLVRTNGTYHLVTSNSVVGRYYKTTDFITFTPFDIPGFTAIISGLHWDGTQWGAKAATGQAAYSADGEAWTGVVEVAGPYSGGGFWKFAGLWLSGGIAGASGIQSSPDIETWTDRQNTGAAVIQGFTDNGSIAVAVGTGGTIYTTPDGITYTARVSGTAQTLSGVFWSPGLVLFVAFGGAGVILTSPDGITWTVQVSGSAATLEVGAAAT